MTVKRGIRHGFGFLVLAALVGVVHGTFSLYWSCGGKWLLDTVGQGVAEAFDERAWLLAVTGGIKIVAAVVPMFVTWSKWRNVKAWRFASWAGACVLMLWGGVNTLTANLVVWNIVAAPPSPDSAGLGGHALIWDPLFLLWGFFLAAGLFFTRDRKSTPGTTEGCS